MVKYACKGTSCGCLIMLSLRCTRIFQSVCRKSACARVCETQFSRVRIPPCAKSVRQWIGFVLRDEKKRYTKVCGNVFYSNICDHSAMREVLRYILRRHAKASLARKWIPCDPNSCQKISFRTVRETLKFSAAAFAGMIARRLYYL